MGLRALLALWLGKLSIWLSRLSGHGGSNLPGRLARKLAPDLLIRLGRRVDRKVLITGTNGKTTTAKLLNGMLKLAGQRVIHNRTGANLITGLTTAFIEAVGIFGRAAPTAILEVDEATVPRAAQELRPEVLLVTNFFRDQLDRFGELAHTVAIVRQGLPHLHENGVVVLNADDPLVAGIGRQYTGRAVYFGLEDRSQHQDEVGVPTDAKHCVECGHTYEYEAVYYAHLGVYRCPNCGNARPEPQVRVQRIEEAPGGEGSLLDIETPAGGFTARLPVAGLYNVYNALAATAVGLTLGLSTEVLRQGIESFTTSFGRMESLEIDEKELRIALVKNPVGFNQVLRTAVQDGGPGLVIAINDRYADGTDVSWLWDVHFERLAEAGHQAPQWVISTGIRGADMALRLKYAGYPTDRIVLEEDLEAALRQALERTSPGERLYVLPTYTAMLEVRQVLHTWGHASRFWREAR